jgi:hypothetical protein
LTVICTEMGKEILTVARRKKKRDCAGKHEGRVRVVVASKAVSEEARWVGGYGLAMGRGRAERVRSDSMLGRSQGMAEDRAGADAGEDGVAADTCAQHIGAL